MSGRRRRSENLWDKNEEKTPPADSGGKFRLQDRDLHSDAFRGTSPKWSNSEANGGGKISGKPSWEGNRHNKMQTDPSFDNWDKQHSTRPLDDGYGPPYRGRDRGAGGNLRMSRDRDRDRSSSPNRSRSRGRVNARGISRSRSRSRGRDWETTRARSRSPFRDDRYKSNEYGNIRNNQRPSSQLCKDFASGNCRRGTHCKFSHQQTLNSRGRDTYHRDDRNDEDHKRQFNRNCRAVCKFFAAGNCNRNDCRFSHDAPPQSESHDDERPRGRNSGNNSRTWNDQHDDFNPSDFGEKNKSWNGPTWGDYESGGFDQRSRDKIQSDDKKSSWNGPTWDDVESGGFKETARDKFQGHNLDDKKTSWGGPTWDDVESGGFKETAPDKFQGHHSDDKKNSWAGPTWDDVESGGFNERPRDNIQADDKKNSWAGPTWDDVETSRDNNSDDKNKSWGGRTWDSSGVGKSNTNLDNKKESWNGAKSRNDDIDGKTQKWNGPLWGEAEVGNLSGRDNNIRKWDAPDLNQTADEKNDHLSSQWKTDAGVSSKQENQQLQLFSSHVNTTSSSHVKHSFDLNSDDNDTLPEDENPQILASGTDCIQSVHNMNSQPLSYLNGPKVQSNKGEKLLKPSEIGDLNEPQKGQLPPVYSELNLTNAIDFLKSLPNPASDTRPKDDHKTSVPIGILSGSARQENQMPESVRNPHGTENANKKEEEINNPDSAEAQGKVEEGDDEKALRLFKISLVELVKEILKPKWKEGVLTREVHKTVVKKVVEKVATSIHGNQIPRPQPKVDQYLAYSKPKITKLVEAYVEKHLKV